MNVTKIIADSIRGMTDEELVALLKPDQLSIDVVPRRTTSMTPQTKKAKIPVSPRPAKTKNGNGEVKFSDDKIVEFIASQGAVARADVIKHFACSGQQASRALRGLVDSQRIYSAGERRLTRYSLNKKMATDASLAK